MANCTGILRADAYEGFNGLYAPGRQPGPILEAVCWAHGRCKLFKLAQVHHMPLAIEAVRQRDIAPLVAALKAWMHAEWAKLSRNNDLAQAMDYMLKYGSREPRQ